MVVKGCSYINYDIYLCDWLMVNYHDNIIAIYIPRLTYRILTNKRKKNNLAIFVVKIIINLVELLYSWRSVFRQSLLVRDYNVHSGVNVILVNNAVTICHRVDAGTETD